MSKTKKWILPTYNTKNAELISEKCSVSSLVGQILAARGYDHKQAKNFLNTSYCFHDPFLLKDMSKAIDIIKESVKNKVKIAVYGDYDVDGITATYIMYDYLSNSGADVQYYIPDRISEGYGMSIKGIDTLKSDGVGLIITVDVGITAVDEVRYALSNGIDVVVTDHHTLKDTLPNAKAIINPKITETGYPFDALAGVGVAFKLVYALSGCDEKIFDKYCPIAAIGTIADMVPLTDENRYIASVGIDRLKKTSNIGIKSLIDVTGKDISKITSSDIGYVLSPRLNAAGRIESANSSVELLLETNPEEAVKKAKILDEFNKQRQIEEQRIFKEALKIIKENNYEDDNYILVAKKGWLHGVIGIVSSRITDMFCKPSSVISINSDGTGKASGRSIKGINIFEALKSCSDSLIKFGGHELAAGFTVKADMTDKFRYDMNKYLDNIMTESIATPVINIDSYISIDDINLNVIKELSVLEPYGIGNNVPVFCLKDVQIESIRYTADGKHAFITVKRNGIYAEISAFSMAQQIREYNIGDKISIVGILNTNTYKGNISAQFIARDVRISDIEKSINRNDLALIFDSIRREINFGDFSIDKINLEPENPNSDFIKFKKAKRQTALKIFEELKIIEISERKNRLYINEGINYKIKTELTKSETYIRYQVN